MSIDPYSFVNGPAGTLSFTWAPHKDEPLRVARDLDEAAASLEDEYHMLLAAREVVVHDVESHFAAGVGPDGPWEALGGRRQKAARVGAHRQAQERFYAQSALPGDPSYIEYPGDQPTPGTPSHLTDTGAGRRGATAIKSYVIESDKMGGTITFNATPPHFMIEHNKGLPERFTYGGFHEGPNPLPQREWMWLSEKAADSIYQIFEDFVDDAVAIVVNPLTGGANIRTTGGFFQSPTAFYG